MKPDQALAWMQDGTQRLLADVAGLSEEALAGPTALPGWSRRYLVSHIAANADALRNLVHWARTGEERRMYASTEQREADIAAGSRLPLAELRAWVVSSAGELAAELGALPGAAWDAKVITAQGLTRPASEIPWMRGREVYIHGIDLGAGTRWTDLPGSFLAALLDEVTARRSANGGGPALAVAATDSGQTWEVTGAGAPVPVSAPLADLAAYLTGRPAPGVRAAPVLPAWL
ncbi:MAG TPA: maleylpyruvate isomerase family mycothiol-dependent enzyme [Trebonia sp.]|jgi:maleylpyruvate isomerase|nr:maleylpyruvate isomerase family mycothiol-dependent enzyme [Trebonia sp.]